jgi:hypothetical protein
LVHDAWKRSKDRIAHELASAQRILEAPQAVYANIAEPLRIAFDVLQRSSELYRNGSPKIRRLMNQFFFKKPLIEDESVAGAVLDEPWLTLVAEEFIEEIRQQEKAPQAVSLGPSSKMSALVPLAGTERKGAQTGRSVDQR